MNLYFTKLYVFLLLVICRLLSGLSPLFISRKVKKKCALDGVGKRWVEKGVSYSMDFSGGILLATSFIHMIPEVREHLVEIMGPRYTFPFAETLVCIGFFTVYVIEEIVRHIVEDKSWHHHHNNEKAEVLISVKETKPSFLEVKLKNEHEAMDNGDNANNIQLVSSNNKTLVEEMNELNAMVKDEASECNNNSKNMNNNNLKHFLLVSALSFHSVMEGVALGLATSLQELWYLFLAVMAHECTILLCVGIELVANCSSASTIIKYMAVLALVSPAGGVIGTLITLIVKEHGAPEVEMSVVYILQGLAAGTILYVTFFEVLNNHKHHHHHQIGNRTPHNHHSESGLPKLAFIAMGFTFMILLELTSGHEKNVHGHGHNDTFSANSSICSH